MNGCVAVFEHRLFRVSCQTRCEGHGGAKSAERTNQMDPRNQSGPLQSPCLGRPAPFFRRKAETPRAGWPPGRQRTGSGPAGPRSLGTTAWEGKTWRFPRRAAGNRSVRSPEAWGTPTGRSTRASMELKIAALAPIPSARGRIVTRAKPGFGAARATHTGGRGASGAEKHANDHGRATHVVETMTFPQVPDGGTVRSWDTELRERHRAADRAKALPWAGSSGKSSPRRNSGSARPCEN